MKKLLLIFIFATLFFTGCFKYDYFKNTATTEYFNLNDTVSIRAGQTLFNPNEGVYITFDSVKNDSRCPYGAECFWAGMAETVFHYARAGQPVYFTLNTLSTMGNDTTIDHYNIKLT